MSYGLEICILADYILLNHFLDVTDQIYERKLPSFIDAGGHNTFEVTGIPIRDLFIEVTDG